MDLIDTDVLDYCPIKGGIPLMSIGLKKLPAYDNPNKNKIFQIDEYFSLYRKSKVLSHKERSSKYYQSLNSNYPQIIEWMVLKLQTEWPEHFKFQDRVLTCNLTEEKLVFKSDFSLNHEESDTKLMYTDAFDALGMQIQEDFVLMKFNADSTDHAEVISLFVPNDWSAEIAIGKSFSYIHNPVPNIDKIIRKPSQMIQGLVSKKESYERVGAISMRTQFVLNEHPEYFQKNTQNPFDPKNPQLAIRFERQTVSGFPYEKMFLFTIRTYFKNLHTVPRNSSDWENIQNIIRTDYSEKDINKHAKKFLVNNRQKLLYWIDSVK